VSEDATVSNDASRPPAQAEALRGADAAQQLALEGLVATLHDQVEALRGADAALQRGLEGLSATLQGQIDELRTHEHRATAETLVGMTLSAMRDVEATAEPPELATTPSFATIILNYRVLRSLAWQADRRARSADWSGVLEVARVAAEWACFNHPGVFSNTAIEMALAEAGRHLLTGTVPARRASSRPRRRVIHVLTQALPIGGHTRLAERWMRFDSASDHSVILTEQGNLAVPEALEAAATLGLHRIDAPTPTDGVRDLRTLLIDADVVVLHIHPYDAVAVAGCADPTGPPVVFVNHGDHVFWLGVGISDIVVNIRPSGATLTVDRRGVPSERSVVLPLPLDEVHRTRLRPEAKRALNIADDTVVMLTMASAIKYAPVGEPTFAALVREVLANAPQAMLIGVGPDLRTPGWRSLAESYPGRVTAYGPRTDTALLLEAADVYLDSLPFASITSLLEASLYGTPVVCFRGRDSGAMAADDAAVELPCFETADDWIDAVGALVRDIDRRQRLGTELAEQVGAAHFASSWSPRLDGVYPLTRRAPIVPSSPDGPLVTPFDVALQCFQEANRLSRPLETLLAAHHLLDAAFA
jgi:hypothetical protein